MDVIYSLKFLDNEGRSEIRKIGQFYEPVHFTRAYLRHLITAKEFLAGTLISIHNLRSLINLMNEIRTYIAEGRFEEKIPLLLERWVNNAKRMVNG